MTGQRWWVSLIEAKVNTAIGFVVAVLMWQLVIVPLFDSINTTTTEAVIVTVIMTVVSVVRSYAVRRVFNWWTVRADTKPRVVRDFFGNKLKTKN